MEVIAIGRVRRYEYHFHKGDRSYTAYLQSGGMKKKEKEGGKKWNTKKERKRLMNE